MWEDGDREGERGRQGGARGKGKLRGGPRERPGGGRDTTSRAQACPPSLLEQLTKQGRKRKQRQAKSLGNLGDANQGDGCQEGRLGWKGGRPWAGN